MFVCAIYIPLTCHTDSCKFGGIAHAPAVFLRGDSLQEVLANGLPGIERKEQTSGPTFY